MRRGRHPEPFDRYRRGARGIPISLDERLQPRPRLIPLSRDAVERPSRFIERLWLELEEVLASPDAPDEPGVLEHPKVLGDRLPCERRALGETRLPDSSADRYGLMLSRSRLFAAIRSATSDGSAASLGVVDSRALAVHLAATQ